MKLELWHEQHFLCSLVKNWKCHKACKLEINKNILCSYWELLERCKLTSKASKAQCCEVSLPEQSSLPFEILVCSSSSALLATEQVQEWIWQPNPSKCVTSPLHQGMHFLNCKPVTHPGFSIILVIYERSDFTSAKSNSYGSHKIIESPIPIFFNLLILHFLNTQHLNIVFGYHWVELKYQFRKKPKLPGCW